MGEKNYFIPCLIFLIIITIQFIRERKLYKLLGIFLFLIAVFEYSSVSIGINSKIRTALTIIVVILGAVVAGLLAIEKQKDNRY